MDISHSYVLRVVMKSMLKKLDQMEMRCHLELLDPPRQDTSWLQIEEPLEPAWMSDHYVSSLDQSLSAHIREKPVA